MSSEQLPQQFKKHLIYVILGRKPNLSAHSTLPVNNKLEQIPIEFTHSPCA